VYRLAARKTEWDFTDEVFGTHSPLPADMTCPLPASTLNPVLEDRNPPVLSAPSVDYRQNRGDLEGRPSV